MPSNFTNLVVTWFDESDNYVTNENITIDVIDLPQFTDTGSGEVNEAIVILKAPYGKRITSISPAQIDQFDRIRIQVDDNNGNSYERYFEIDTMVPSESKDEGTLLTLNCLGIEYHTQRIHFSRQFWFSSAFLPGLVVGTTYEDNRGTKQPVLSGNDSAYDPDTAVGNDLSQFTQNIYDYGIAPVFCYDVWVDLIDRLGAPAAGGGVFDFFELGFDSTGVNTMNLRIFSSGSTPESKTGSPTPVTITKTLSINPSEGEGIISNLTGTVTHVIGDARSGALQKGREQYNSGIFQFTFRPEYVNSINYNIDAKVLFSGQHYKSKINNNLNNTPPGPTTGVPDSDANWEQIDMSDEFGDSVQYSEWTDDKAALIVNAGTNPAAVTVLSGVFTSTGAGAFDGNVIINDNGFFRTPVDDHAIGAGGVPSQPLTTAYLYAGGFAFPRGYRFLNEGTGLFNAGAKDPNDIEFEDSVVEVQENPNPNIEGELFFVKYKLDSTNDKMQIVVLNENKVFQWNNSTTDFTDITTDDLGSDCLHKWDTIRNVDGFDPKPSETDSAKFPDVTKDGNPFATNIDSAIQIVYDFNSAFTDRFLDREKYQSHGAWFNFRFPYPVSTLNSITEGVGDIYGGGTRSVSTGINEPATLDISNMGFTPKGFLGFNKEDSERLQPLTTFSFSIGLLIEGRNPADGSLFTLDGTASIRILMGDTNDNVWAFDFEIPETNGNQIPIDTQLSNYQVYRGHKPRFATLNNIPDLINPKDIDKQNIMEQRNIKWIVIQHQDQYDEFGRFAPEGNLNDLSNTSLSAALGGKITITIDDLHFKKALFVSSGVDTERDLEPDFVQRQDIMLFDQALQVAQAQEQIEKFRHKEFDIMTTGKSVFDIRFGDSFFLQDDRLVSDADDGPNTIKLVAKRIEYSISRPQAGSGGLQRRIKGIKRFT